MKIWKEGEASRTICPTCQRRADVTFRRRTVALDPGVSIPDVLVAVCCDCDGIALIPHQSTPRLSAGFKRATVTVNARVPGHLIDVLLLLAAGAGSNRKASTAAVLRFLLSEFASNPDVALRVRESISHELLDAPGDQEVSIRIPAELLVQVDEAAANVGIESRTTVIKGLLAVAKEDVLDGGDEVLGSTMRRALAAVT